MNPDDFWTDKLCDGDSKARSVYIPKTERVFLALFGKVYTTNAIVHTVRYCLSKSPDAKNLSREEFDAFMDCFGPGSVSEALNTCVGNVVFNSSGVWNEWFIGHESADAELKRRARGGVYCVRFGSTAGSFTLIYTRMGDDGRTVQMAKRSVFRHHKTGKFSCSKNPSPDHSELQRQPYRTIQALIDTVWREKCIEPVHPSYWNAVRASASSPTQSAGLEDDGYSGGYANTGSSFSHSGYGDFDAEQEDGGGGKSRYMAYNPKEKKSNSTSTSIEYGEFDHAKSSSSSSSSSHARREPKPQSTYAEFDCAFEDSTSSISVYSQYKPPPAKAKEKRDDTDIVSSKQDAYAEWDG